MKIRIPSKPKIAIAYFDVTQDSVIGKDIIGMYNLLTKMGLYVVIIAEVIDDKISALHKTQIIKDVGNINFDLIIYHHSHYWQLGAQLLNKFQGEIIFKYHDITPAHFFEPYSLTLQKKYLLNQSMTYNLLQKYSEYFWIADSVYIGNELLGFETPPNNLYIVPPFNNLKLEVDQSIKNSDVKKLLFIGDFMPHKGHSFLLRIIREYLDNFSLSVELHLVGSIELTPNYMYEIITLIEQYNLEEYVKIFTESQSTDPLYHYQNADLFICFSEHEGYCDRILTAQSYGIPVIAGNSSGIREIVGDYPLDAFPKNTDDFSYYAYLINEILCKKEIYDSFANCGINNVANRFLNHHIESKYIRAIYPVLEKYK